MAVLVSVEVEGPVTHCYEVERPVLVVDEVDPVSLAVCVQFGNAYAEIEAQSLVDVIDELGEIAHTVSYYAGQIASLASTCVRAQATVTAQAKLAGAVVLSATRVS